MSKKTKSGRRSKSATYRETSRGLAASYVFVAPLFGVYQIGLALDPSIRNGTDPIFREVFQRFSHLGLVFLNLVVLGLLLLAIWHTRAARRFHRGLYGLMFLESCAWAGFMLLTGSLIARELLALPPLARHLLSSAGAGIYEEVLFRLVLMGVPVFVLHRLLGGSPWWVVPAALVVSALLFSQAHHDLGGEPWNRGVFLYRAGMGVVLGLVFWTRGLGIVVYAHALYNVALILLTNDAAG